MNEKVEYEFRVVETEDGFRIELKGDKEQLRQMIYGRGAFGGFGRFGGHGKFGGFGRFGWRRRFGGRGRSGGHRHHGPHEHGEHEKPKRRYDLGPWWDQDTIPDDQLQV